MCMCVNENKRKTLRGSAPNDESIKTDSVQWPQHSFIIHVLSSVARNHVDLLLLFSQSIGLGISGSFPYLTQKCNKTATE